MFLPSQVEEEGPELDTTDQSETVEFRSDIASHGLLTEYLY